MERAPSDDTFVTYIGSTQSLRGQATDNNTKKSYYGWSHGGLKGFDQTLGLVQLHEKQFFVGTGKGMDMNYSSPTPNGSSSYLTGLRRGRTHASPMLALGSGPNPFDSSLES